MTPIYAGAVPRRRLADIQDQRKLARMGVKLHLLGALAWDYADTCCDIAIGLRIQQTKGVSRAIRELKRDYDRFRSGFLSEESLAEEARLGLLFEDVCAAHFSRLNYGIVADKAVKGLDPEWMMLVKAVHMGMVVLDAMTLYAAECDGWIRRQGVRGHSILSDHFRRLAVLVPQFAGDRYTYRLEARRLTARILLKEINSIEIFDDNGEI